MEALGQANLQACLAAVHATNKLLAGIDEPSQWAPPQRCTAREQEVLRWLAAGKTDRDIAAILDISPRTVHKHLQRIYEKLGVETRTAAVVRAMNLQL